MQYTALKKLAIPALLAALLCLPALPSEAVTLSAGQKAPNFTLKDVNGKDVKLSSYNGKVVLVNFWATWCGPCKIEIPWFNEFQQKYQDKGFVVLGISADDTVEQLKPFVAQYKMTYPVLVGLGRDDVQEALGPVYGLPTTLLISRDGKVCQKHMGLAKKAEFEKGILGLL